MPTLCSVPGCKSNSNNAPGYTKCFLFPKDAELRTKWLRAIRTPDLQIATSTNVCVKHFEEEQIKKGVYFIINGKNTFLPNKKWTLKPGAIPTIFPETEDETLNFIKARVRLNHKFTKTMNNIEAWNEIAKEIQCEPNASGLSKRWCNLQDMYKKCINDDATAENWPYFDEMHRWANLTGFNVYPPYVISKDDAKRNVNDMNMAWNEQNENLLIELLKEREHIYNRNHPNYKTYNVIKECSDIAKLFEPSKTSKEILDKITSIRKDLAKLRNTIESNNSNLNLPPLFEKCKFMYTALFGDIPSHILKRKIKDIESVKKNDAPNLNSMEEKPNCFKKIKLNELETLLKNVQYDSENDIDCSEVETETEITSNSNEVTQCEKLSGAEKGNILRSIINLIKDKPFLWDSKHSKFGDIEYNKQILKDFGKTLNPPISVNLVQYRIRYLRKTFFKSLKYGKKWSLFNDCKFFLNSEKNINKKFAINKKNYDNKANLSKIIKFIEDKPYLFDIKHPQYNNIKLKKKYLTTLGCTLNPTLSYSSLITYINDLRTIFYKYLKMGSQTTWPWWLDDCKFFLGKDKNNSDDELYNKNTKITEVVNNNDIQKFSDELFDSFAPNEENSKEIGIQCNLYEELLNDKIRTIQFKECSCYMDILNIIQSFKPIDTNLELLKNKEENNICMDVQLIDDENNTDTQSIPLNDEEFHVSNGEIEMKFSDFENVSNTDSSDYGLTEMPFPEISKPRKKKTSDDHIILYECTFCKKDFKSHYLFDKHYTKFHAERSKLCCICGRISTNFRRMQNHENYCNPNDNPYCYECKQVFKSKINYFDHFNIKHNKKKSPYICCCNRSFKKYTKFVFHLNKYHCGTIDLCTIPDYTTKEFLETFLELKCNKDDQNVVANNLTEEKLKFWCRICKRNFYNNRAYMIHFYQEFHKIPEKEWLEAYCFEEAFECELCDKRLSDLGDLVKHRHKYHHRCTLDEYIKNLEYGPNMQDEPIIIIQPTDYSKIYSNCHICKRKFYMPDFEFHFKDMEHINLEKRWLEKHNIKEFNCSNCSINYKSLLDYLIHKNSEHNEWPTNTILKSIKGDTGDVIPDFLQDKINTKLIYKCSVCNYYTPYKKAHIDHMLYHYPKKIIQCSCGKQFITRDLLFNHRNKIGCQKEGCIIPRFVIQSSSFVNANLIS